MENGKLQLLIGGEEKIDYHTEVYCLDSGTIIYYLRNRFFVKWGGREVEAKFDGYVDSYCNSMIVKGNALFFTIKEDIHKVVFVPPNIYRKSDRSIKRASRDYDGKSYCYKICDDPLRDAIILDLPRRERNIINTIHRGKGMQIVHSTKFSQAKVRKIEENYFSIEVPTKHIDYRKLMNFKFISRDSSPFIYIYHDFQLYTLDTETMRFLPTLPFEKECDRVLSGRNDIELLNVINGIVTVTVENICGYLITRLPEDYFVSEGSVVLAETDQRIKELESAQAQWLKDKDQLEKKLQEAEKQLLAAESRRMEEEEKNKEDKIREAEGDEPTKIAQNLLQDELSRLDLSTCSSEYLRNLQQRIKDMELIAAESERTMEEQRRREEEEQRRIAQEKIAKDLAERRQKVAAEMARLEEENRRIEEEERRILNLDDLPPPPPHIVVTTPPAMSGITRKTVPISISPSVHTSHIPSAPPLFAPKPAAAVAAKIQEGSVTSPKPNDARSDLFAEIRSAARSRKVPVAEVPSEPVIDGGLSLAAILKRRMVQIRGREEDNEEESEEEDSWNI